MLNLVNVEKSYNNNIALKNITISLEEKKLYILVGANGSGKSTLIKILANVIFKTKGTIENNSIISYLPDKYLLPKIMNTKDFIDDFISLYNLKINSLDIL
ncbi:MAG: ATP-binding cassette domain-containing protein, partial [Acholeplasmatales bacterium]|nr:ATP-binding cassette domain-containing protein [Acholeplasmatales bacterium]